MQFVELIESLFFSLPCMPCIAGCAAIVRERQQDFVLFVSTILLLLDAMYLPGVYIFPTALSSFVHKHSNE